ncbi:MAG TPA: hypothetical protein VHC41_03100 [Mycobacteriales bacterium]|nr:hypothetical protein [Mycobacteriales bacterium]
MDAKESACAAREARKSAESRVSSSHSPAELADRAIRRYLAAEQGRNREEPGAEEARPPE